MVNHIVFQLGHVVEETCQVNNLLLENLTQQVQKGRSKAECSIGEHGIMTTKYHLSQQGCDIKGF